MRLIHHSRNGKSFQWTVSLGRTAADLLAVSGALQTVPCRAVPCRVVPCRAVPCRAAAGRLSARLVGRCRSCRCRLMSPRRRHGRPHRTAPISGRLPAGHVTPAIGSRDQIRRPIAGRVTTPVPWRRRRQVERRRVSPSLPLSLLPPLPRRAFCLTSVRDVIT